MDFKEKFVSWIWACIQTVTFETLVDGEHSTIFGSSRGIRQGDPLFPMIFVVAIPTLLDYTEEQGKKKTLGKLACSVNHLFFANDVFFVKATTSSVKHIKEILQSFSNASGIQANMVKSKIIFNKCVSAQVRHASNFREETMLVKYYGSHLLKEVSLSTISGSPRQRKKLTFYGCNTLSLARRAEIIKYVVAP